MRRRGDSGEEHLPRGCAVPGLIPNNAKPKQNLKEHSSLMGWIARLQVPPGEVLKSRAAVPYPLACPPLPACSCGRALSGGKRGSCCVASADSAFQVRWVISPPRALLIPCWRVLAQWVLEEQQLAPGLLPSLLGVSSTQFPFLLCFSTHRSTPTTPHPTSGRDGDGAEETSVAAELSGPWVSCLRVR